MWTNSLLKSNGWNSVKRYYWWAFLVCIVCNAINAGNSAVSSGASGFANLSTNYGQIASSPAFADIDADMPEGTLPFATVIILVGLIVFLILLIFAFAMIAFLGNPATCGKNRFFLEARRGNGRFVQVFSHFRRGRYRNTVRVMFLRDMYVGLWSLLLIVPGIIKAYEYFLIPYLLAENPALPKERAFEISRQTMEGEKWRLFVLQLSFIGWYLLGVLALGIGGIFVNPYYEATMAEFYTCMRAKMMSYGFTNESELEEIV